MCKLVGHIFKTAGMLCLIPVIISVTAAGRPDMIAIISSADPGVTHWGDWGQMEYCPPGTFAHLAQLKVQTPSAFNAGDDTALNGISLICPSKSGSGRKAITSTEGPWGDWFLPTDSCPAALTAFNLKALKPLREGADDDWDDAAATDIVFGCPFRNSNGEPDYKILYTEGLEWAWGQWGDSKYCPRGSGICGIQTQVEQDQGYGDDTSLNNVRFACCKFAKGYYN